MLIEENCDYKYSIFFRAIRKLIFIRSYIFVDQKWSERIKIISRRLENADITIL